MNSSGGNQELAPQPTPPGKRSFNKYGVAGLLASSATRGWSNLAAELRSHSGTVTWNKPQPDAEVCIDVRGSRSVITRRLDGVIDSTVSERGTIWLRPAGVQEGLIDMSEPVPAILHLYLPPSRFSSDHFGDGFNTTAIRSLHREGGFHDPLLAEIAYAIMSELEHETSAGRLLAETLALSLVARLIQNHAGASPSDLANPASREGLDRRRLARVLDYIEANLESDLTVARLASVACLSEFHFSRAFKTAFGESPHRHVSARRLERAKDLLCDADRALVDIALTLRFSCQANFTRAFRRATGQTPAQYRRSLLA
ncbi:AraC family transcriptional regulator [Bradyrhizobium sp. CB2312]|uniref:helix-turn-helix domain-containing protein n=1 Tax=Bradyrhizobium sp. CB2312 TaxID=3039155 RepID=UPI0024B1D42F|nr:AraC family transcriptional regulator [Bradyrhizobium sp. CB2312]WFU73654.1 AraC family transcriptional regulator [Bradyrhizobium sp. CB2312]